MKRPPLICDLIWFTYGNKSMSPVFINFRLIIFFFQFFISLLILTIFYRDRDWQSFLREDQVVKSHTFAKKVPPTPTKAFFY